MNIVIAERAMKAMADLTSTVRKAFHKQLAILFCDPAWMCTSLLISFLTPNRNRVRNLRPASYVN